MSYVGVVPLCVGWCVDPVVAESNSSGIYGTILALAK